MIAWLGALALACLTVIVGCAGVIFIAAIIGSYTGSARIDAAMGAVTRGLLIVAFVAAFILIAAGVLILGNLAIAALASIAP